METSVVIQAHKDTVNRKLEYGDDTSSDDSRVESDYEKFLQDCNCLDFCDIYNILKQEYETNEELQKEIKSQTFLFLDVPKTKSEVINIKEQHSSR